MIIYLFLPSTSTSQPIGNHPARPRNVFYLFAHSRKGMKNLVSVTVKKIEAVQTIDYPFNC
jgi:hypothetical protein